MDYIVDIQGFQSFNNVFIAKEVAILPVLEDAPPTVYHFRPPYPWSSLPREQKSSNRWLEYNFHGLRWGAGEIPYDELRNTLSDRLDDARKIYVKGSEKTKWVLKNVDYPIVHDLEDLGCPSLKRLPELDTTECDLHFHHYHYSCAVHNAHKLRLWVLNNRQRLPTPSTCGDDIHEVDSIGSMDRVRCDCVSPPPADQEMMNIMYN